MADSPQIYKDWQVPPQATSESSRLSFVDDCCSEGQAWIRSQRGYGDFRKALDTISGRDTSPKPSASYRSRLNTNRLKRNIREVVSVMSSMRPFWGYHSDNKAYAKQAEMMNKVTRAWYLEAFADRSVKEALQYAAATGRGWIRPVYRRDMYGTGRGDIKLLTYGAPSVLPTQLPSSGDWQGAYAVTILDEMPVAMAHGMFPMYQDRLRPSSSKYWYQSDGVRTATTGNWIKRAFGKVTGTGDPQLTDLLVPVRYSYVLDLSINTTDRVIPMGEPGSSWAYDVPAIGQDIPVGLDPRTNQMSFRKANENDARLYPYRRLIISSDACIMYDGPNFDWHGMFPGISFCPDEWPWEPLGFSLVHDGYDINEAIKTIDRGNMDKITCSLDMPLAFDVNAISMKDMKRMDPMQPRSRWGYDGSATERMPIEPAIPPEVLKVEPASLEFRQILQDGMDAQMAINDVNALAKARAVGSVEQLEKIMELQGPIVADMSRSMEPPMRDLGNMVKYLVAQYFTTPRLMQYVGADGVSQEVFDYDPASIIPSHMPGDNPEQASPSSKIQRARVFVDNLRFFILPNSLHEYHQMEMKLGLIQLKKAGVKISSQTIAEAWLINNYGTFSGNTEIEKWQSEQEMDLEFAARLEAIKGSLAGDLPAPPGAPAAPGQPPPGAPGPNGAAPEGRPPTFSAPFALKSKDGGTRSTITSSK